MTLVENIFGMQIRRVTDLIGEQGRDAFWLTGIALDAKLISLVVALHERPEQSSSDLATTTGLSRQLVEVRLKKLEKNGYIASSTSPVDARRRLFSITKERAGEVARAVTAMHHFEQVYEELWDELGVDLSSAILALERALHAKPLLSRLCTLRPEYYDLIEVNKHAAG